MYIIFDTETTGLPENYKAPITDTQNWPRIVQISWQLHDEYGYVIKNENFVIKPEGFSIPFNSTQIHGISNEIAQEKGFNIEFVLNEFLKDIEKVKVISGHNVEFDINVLGCEFFRKGIYNDILDKIRLDTCDENTANLCRISGGKGGKYKFPKLEELYYYLFDEKFDYAHNSAFDVQATARCFFELIRVGHFSNSLSFLGGDYLERYRKINTGKTKLSDINLNIELQKEDIKKSYIQKKGNLERIEKIKYFHLHNHTQYSILSSTIEISELIRTAIDYDMPAVGITDYGNLYGAFEFMLEIKKINKNRQIPFLGIIGCEFFISEDYKKKQFTKDSPDKRYNQVLIAKNRKGFNNLSRLSSLGFIEGYYDGLPRISKELILDHREGLVAFTGGLDSQIPYLILNKGIEFAEDVFIWWKNNFGEDFYVEILRHGDLPQEKEVNKVLIEFAKKYDVKIIAQNNNFYMNKEDADAHDILLCLKNGEKQNTPKGKGKGFRFGFPNDEYYFKTQQQVKNIFCDIPEVLENMEDLLAKFENYELEREIVLPKFDIPEGFNNQDEYLRYLTYEGAKKRWSERWEENKERLDLELDIIQKTGYPGYFLIIQDIIKSAKEMGVLVGPGRGSAAGSAVAYSIGITNIDPIKYNLLFERFLNPERISMPDIDIDFDDEGRQKVIDLVIEKYGKNNVAQIITYGTMASKSSVRDVSRVLDYPLPETNILANLLPDTVKLNKLFELDQKKLEETTKDKYEGAKKIIEISKGKDNRAEIINKARILEGSVRNTGTHACGLIITPENIVNLIPVAVAKDSNLLVSQYDNSYVESAGLLKMDFLGLKNLSIIRDTCNRIEKTKGIVIDIDNITLEDNKTYELFSKGETIATFQYESDGMRKYLKDLKPTIFSDLIAMNALYRPGPLEYIPSFIRRKHGKEEIKYDIPEMKEFLEETYGITVYQEQVMLLSQKLAGFTKGEADTLRKAMGKKQSEILVKMKPKFLEGGKNNNYSEQKLEKVWKDWEAFAEYAFNKSHSTCYAFIGYQTGYLKANFPSEYMASVLSKNMNDVKTISFFIQECKRMGIKILQPCINESINNFKVDKNGNIRFGLNAIKGVGESVIDNFVQERKKNGKYKSIFDFIERIDFKSCNKRTLESLAQSGAFDCFEDIHRGQYFELNINGISFIETLIKYKNNLKMQESSNQISIFDQEELVNSILLPKVVSSEPWGTLEKLNKEEEVLGLYISGHPLDDYRDNFRYFVDTNVEDISESNNANIMDKKLHIAGILSNVLHRVSQKGVRWASFDITDFSGTTQIKIFGESYEKYKHFLDNGLIVFIDLRISKGFKEGDIRQDIREIKLLKDKENTEREKIILDIDIKDIDDDFFENLEKIRDLKKGIGRVYLNIVDKEKNLSLEMYSQKELMVEPNIENISFIENLGYEMRFK